MMLLRAVRDADERIRRWLASLPQPRSLRADLLPQRDRAINARPELGRQAQTSFGTAKKGFRPWTVTVCDRALGR